MTKWAPSGYDVYVVGIQEGVSDGIYDIFAEVTGTKRMPIVKNPKDTSDKVLGRGDGSFRNQKFTGIQYFLKPGAEAFVKCVAVAPVRADCGPVVTRPCSRVTLQVSSSGSPLVRCE